MHTREHGAPKVRAAKGNAVYSSWRPARKTGEKEKEWLSKNQDLAWVVKISIVWK